MDFEQYLEHDILKFLDNKIHKAETKKIDREEEYGLYLTKDYLKELSYALDNDELTKAKKLFDELKKNYSKLPKTSYERKKIYALLEKMYAKIQNYVEIKEGKIEVIKEGESEILKERNQNFAAKITDKKRDADIDIFDQEPIDHTTIPITDKKENGKKEVVIIKEEDIKKAQKIEEPNILNAMDTITKPTEITGEEEIINKLNALNAKVDEGNQEQSKKIDALRKEIQNQIEAELAKKLREEKPEIKTYDLHPNNFDSTNSKKIKQSDKILQKKAHFTPEELRTIYEHAIYDLFENRFDEAAQLFSKIIRAQPKNKAAKIRLQECIEQSPGLADKYPEAKELILYSEEKIPLLDAERVNSESGFSKSIEDLEESIEKIENITFEKEEPGQHIKKKYENNTTRLKNIYEHGLNAMKLEKYEEAAKIFKQVLRIRPSNKAAKIKLQECLEAIGNA